MLFRRAKGFHKDPPPPQRTVSGAGLPLDTSTPQQSGSKDGTGSLPPPVVVQTSDDVDGSKKSVDVPPAVLETSRQRVLKLASERFDQEKERSDEVDTEYAGMIDTAIRYVNLHFVSIWERYVMFLYI